MPSPIERGFVKTSYGHIHYRAAGHGATIVLLHINQQSSALYLELMQELGGQLRAIAIDYPGHGMSDHLVTPPTIADYARCVIEVMDALAISAASVLGEAVGAVVAIELAGAFPGRITNAILINCPYYADRATADRRHAPLKGGLRPADASGFPLPRTLEFLLEHDPGHAPMQPSQSWMDRVNVAQMEAGRDRWQALDALHQYDIAGNLARVSCPALLLIGEHFYYVQHRAEFAARMRNLRTEIVAGARFCMTWERASDIGPRVIGFLRETG
jgi:pimeloyl-ACP methyl ester carboxylesterase